MAKHGDGMVKRGNRFGKLRLDFLFVYESRRDDSIVEIPKSNESRNPEGGDTLNLGGSIIAKLVSLNDYRAFQAALLS